MTLIRSFAAAIAVALLVLAPAPSRAEVATVRVSKGYGILYLPLIVMQDLKLFEKQATAAGLGDIQVEWLTFDGGNVINDAMIAGTLDIAGTGAPGFITLWAKTRGNARFEVTGVSGLSSTALVLTTINPKIKSLQDFTATDRIALPGIKTSLSAVVLEMAVAKTFGAENYAKLDPLTVGLSHPDAVAALLTGKTEVDAHFTSPPFTYVELADPRVHQVLSSVDVLGNITLDVVFAPKRFVEANPKTMVAFLAALDEANAFIAENRAGAAEIFARRSPVRVAADEVERMLADPGTRFSTTPNGVMEFASFLASVGTIKAKPAAWTDMFMPLLHGRSGS